MNIKKRYCPFCKKQNQRHHYLSCKDKPDNLSIIELKYEYIKYNFNYLTDINNLYDEYVTNRKSLTELNNKFGIDFKSIGFLLDYFNIKKRNIKDSSDIMLKHSKDTFNKKYGVSNPWEKNAIGYNTRIKNLNEKYNINNVFQRQDVIEKIKISNDITGHKKRKETMKKLYGYESPFQVETIHRKALLNSGKRITKLNKIIYDALDKNNIDYIKEYCIKENDRKYFYDVKIGNILIEINGDYWHANPNKYNIDWVNTNRKQMAKEIWDNDLIKKEVAIKHGYTFVTIWENEIKHNIGKLDEFIQNKIN